MLTRKMKLPYPRYRFRYPLYIYCLAAAASAAAATETPDSVAAKDLQEFVVEAKNQSVEGRTATFIPGARQKNAATDAVSLLSHMAIPQLNVDPISQSVKAIDGSDVAIFIDYVPATQWDLNGMLTKDVKKVEYLIYPTDPRFKGAKYALNFIMQKYEWGGYTKLSAKQYLGVHHTTGSVNSKFTYKRMTYDLFVDEDYTTNRHTGSQTVEQFRFPDLYGSGPQNVERISQPLESRFRSNTNNVSFRALYAADRMQVSNNLSFALAGVPRNNSLNSLTYADSFLPASTSSTMASSRKWQLAYGLNVYSVLRDNMGLSVDAGYTHGRDATDSHYEDDLVDIVNNARETTDYVQVTPYLTWNLNQNNLLMPLGHAEYTSYGINYLGNTPSRQNYCVFGTMLGLQYTYQQQLWSAGALVSWVYTHSDLSGIKDIDNYPQGNVFATLTPDSHNQFSLTYAFGRQMPETYEKSPTMLQQDALMWYAGTPGLGNSWQQNIRATYTWLPNNKWQLAFTANFSAYDDRVVSLYTPTGPDGTMLRRYADDGNFRCGWIMATATGRFLDGKLIAKVTPSFSAYKTTGEYSQSMCTAGGTLQLTWYFGNFYLMGYYTSPSKWLDSDSGSTIHNPSNYLIQLGWGRGALKLSAAAYNFLRTDWETSRTTLTSPYYSNDIRSYGIDYHMSFRLTATYTFGYGKKVHEYDELGGADLSKSAILK